MEIIKELSEFISEEIDDAEKYADRALRYKDMYPGLADTYYRLSSEEMNHMTLLHEQAAKIIEQYRRDNGDPPPSMQAVYDYLHEKQTDHAAMVKAKQAMYK